MKISLNVSFAKSKMTLIERKKNSRRTKAILSQDLGQGELRPLFAELAKLPNSMSFFVNIFTNYKQNYLETSAFQKWLRRLQVVEIRRLNQHSKCQDSTFQRASKRTVRVPCGSI